MILYRNIVFFLSLQCEMRYFSSWSLIIHQSCSKYPTMKKNNSTSCVSVFVITSWIYRQLLFYSAENSNRGSQKHNEYIASWIFTLHSIRDFESKKASKTCCISVKDKLELNHCFWQTENFPKVWYKVMNKREGESVLKVAYLHLSATTYKGSFPRKL